MMLRILSAACLVCLASIGSAADYEIVEKRDAIRIETMSFATERHSQTVRILTDEGTSYKEYLGVNGYVQIKNIDVTIASSGGSTSKMKKDRIFEVPIVESADMITDYKAIVIAPEGLRRGDLITINYDRSITSLLYIDPWVFATRVPIARASCSITYPSTVPMKYRGADSTVRVSKTESMGVVTLTLDTASQREIYLSGRAESFNNVEKKVVFMPERTMTEKWALSTKSWKDVAQWFTELTRFAYRDDPGMDFVVQEIKRTATSQEQIAERIYQYIQQNFVYMAVEIGIGGYKPRFAAQTFQKKYGDCKDLTFLYLVLLKKAGIEGYPALVDTRDAKFFYDDFPTPTQFNHCIAYLPRLRNGIWVDTTVKNFKLGEIPAVIQGKRALVAGGPDALLQIPEDFYNSNVLKFELNGVYDDSVLKMRGSVQTLGQANAYLDLMKNALMRNAVKHYVFEKLLRQGLPVQDLQVDGSTDRSLQLQFLTPVQTLEQYKLLLVNSLSYPPLENLGVEPSQNEFFALGIPLRLVLDSTIDLGGRRVVTPPVSSEIRGAFVSYKLQWKEEAGKLHYFADVYFANGFLDSLEMKKYREELQEFASELQRTVVIQ